jgi:hypothetical protein
MKKKWLQRTKWRLRSLMMWDLARLGLAKSELTWKNLWLVRKVVSSSIGLIRLRIERSLLYVTPLFSPSSSLSLDSSLSILRIAFTILLRFAPTAFLTCFVRVFKIVSKTVSKRLEHQRGAKKSSDSHSGTTNSTAGDAATACEQGLVLASKPSPVLTVGGGGHSGRADGGHSVGSRRHEDNVVRRLAYI